MIKGDNNRTSKMASQFALLKPPSFNGKPGALFAIWDMKIRAYAQEKSFSEALMDSFKAKMPANEVDVLDATIAAEKLQI